MSYVVDFDDVSTTGLESSPVAPALAGLRANEARYFKNKYDHDLTVEPASSATETVDWVHRILKEERDLVIAARPLEATGYQVANIRMAYVFYESGLSMPVGREMGKPELKRLRASGTTSTPGWASGSPPYGITGPGDYTVVHSGTSGRD